MNVTTEIKKRKAPQRDEADRLFADLHTYMSTFHPDELEEFVTEFVDERENWVEVRRTEGHEDSLVAASVTYVKGFRKTLSSAYMRMQAQSLHLIVPDVRPLYHEETVYRSTEDCIKIIDNLRSRLESARAYCLPISS